MNEKVKSGILGLCVGDALGVPVEFKPRRYLDSNPVTGMLSYGTHDQPKGTWSDDSSLTLCLLESLTQGYDPEEIGKNFLRWRELGHLTPHGEVFDIGIATASALRMIREGVPALQAGGNGERDNGNGSLMRILPMVYFFEKKGWDSNYWKIIFEVSSITHNHIRSKVSCWIYVDFARELLAGKNPEQSYLQICGKTEDYLAQLNDKEFVYFQKILSGNLATMRREDVHSSGYVIHSLEASLWCVLNSNTYEEAVLKAVNLGDDTDTTAAIAGGLAGIYYGLQNIPKDWLDSLVLREKIETLCDKFALAS